MIFDPDMTPVKPYFIQALHQWISDNGLTPLIVVDANFEGLRVPPGIDDEGKITLNVSWGATDHLNMDEELMTFSARFSGRSQALIVPMESIISIFARENSKGMVFEVETEPSQSTSTAKEGAEPTLKEAKDTESQEKTPQKSKPKENKPSGKRPHLTIVD
ncbi:ClpXP protease specificity-enhancing factor [Marinicella rhabdoformis]|uniref:ClpXP protease specificity-enhancing factor n=1 Tax=Marinicella rhabdoformis TaxID=2580566 RepID=UPI0015D0C548|nr:ClpXP protease specificity-enhancing factor [Marinicella rhabdoformis]